MRHGIFFARLRTQKGKTKKNMKQEDDDPHLMRLTNIDDSPSVKDDVSAFYKLLNTVVSVSILETRTEHLDDLSKQVLYDVGFRRSSDGVFRKVQLSNQKGVSRFVEFWNDDMLRRRRMFQQKNTAMVESALNTGLAMATAAIATAIPYHLLNRGYEKQRKDLQEELNSKSKEVAVHIQLGEQQATRFAEEMRGLKATHEQQRRSFDEALAQQSEALTRALEEHRTRDAEAKPDGFMDHMTDVLTKLQEADRTKQELDILQSEMRTQGL